MSNSLVVFAYFLLFISTCDTDFLYSTHQKVYAISWNEVMWDSRTENKEFIKILKLNCSDSLL